MKETALSWSIQYLYSVKGCRGNMTSYPLDVLMVISEKEYGINGSTILRR